MDEGLVGHWEIYQRTDTVTMLPAFLQGEDLVITDDYFVVISKVFGSTGRQTVKTVANSL